ncbi:MAG: Rid family detoxifying hydrolase [Acidobacteriota bacterium]
MKKSFHPSQGPPAVGPYSPSVQANGWVFVSGQIPMKPNGEILRGAIEDQVRQVLENVSAVLESAGSSLEKVVKVCIYLDDIGHFQAMNEVYAAYFGDSRPARSTVEVARLPKDVGVEIDVIALA